jgi:hypothetical protein
MTVIAGLDVATTTGLAVFDGGRLVHAEAYRPPGKTNGEINSGFRAWLLSMFKAHAVEYVAGEEPLVTNLKDKAGDPIVTMSTYRRIYGLYGVLEELCATLNLPFEAVHQATWRKAFLGNGRGDKDMSLAQCKQLRWPIKSKDAAEAAGVAWWLAGHLRLAQLVRPGELFSEKAPA